jgi:hypothetical protein
MRAKIQFLGQALLSRLIERFGPLPDEPAKDQKERIHLLTGFTIFADWIGSNADWFPTNCTIDKASITTVAEACLKELRWKASPKLELDFGQQFDLA